MDTNKQHHEYTSDAHQKLSSDRNRQKIAHTMIDLY